MRIPLVPEKKSSSNGNLVYVHSCLLEILRGRVVELGWFCPLDREIVDVQFTPNPCAATA
jgi:hypothetical protein